MVIEFEISAREQYRNTDKVRKLFHVSPEAPFQVFGAIIDVALHSA